MKEKKELVICVDCGYSSIKVIVNGMLISKKKKGYVPIGSEVVPIDSQTEFVQDKSNDYIEVDYMGAKYLIGDYARNLLLETKWKEKQDFIKDAQQSYDRFTSNQFEVSLIGCIGYGIIKYCEFVQINKNKLEPVDVITIEELPYVDIYLALAVPHSMYKTRKEGSVPTLIKKIFREHDYEMQIGNKRYNLKYTIHNEPTKRIIQSQAIAAFAGAIIPDDETGETAGKTQIDPMKVPILIIDGGYKTIGLFRLTRGGVVQDDESNVDYSMSVIDDKIEEELARLGRDDIKAYNIETLANNPAERVIQVKEGDSWVDYDLLEARNRYAEELCKEFIMYLNSKFNCFKDVKQVFITGGTGAMYYKMLKEYIEEKTSMRGPIELAQYKMNRQNVDAVYSIAAGLSKQFKQFLELHSKEG